MPPKPMRNAQGSVLIYIVWMIVLLSLFGLSVGSQALFALDLSERLSGQLQATYIAKGAAAYLAAILERDATPSYDGDREVWADDPTLFQDRPLAGGRFSLIAEDTPQGGGRAGLIDEERRINLNTATADVLQDLVLAVSTVSEREALDVAESIEDWRDEDDTARPHGAENLYYRSHGYDSKDGPFENVEELRLVHGVSEELYRRLEPYVTVHGTGALNLNTASDTVLRALGLSEEGLAALVFYLIGEDMHPGTGDDREFTSIGAIQSDLGGSVPLEDLTRLSALAADGVVGVRSEAFRTTIHASYGAETNAMRARCVLSRKGDVLLWEER